MARFAAEASATGVIGADVDFGEPGVTDLGSTSVVLEGAGPRHTASAYALNERFDELVDPVQRDRRRLLRAVIASGYALIGDVPGQVYVPDRVGVLRLPTGLRVAAATVPWPRPEPDRFLHPSSTRSSTHCGVLTGDVAATAYRAALANPGQRWLVDGQTVTLAVTPLAIGLDC